MSIQANIDWAFSRILPGPEWKLGLVTLAFHADERDRGSISFELFTQQAACRDAAQARSILEALEGLGMIYANVTDDTLSFRLRK